MSKPLCQLEPNSEHPILLFELIYSLSWQLFVASLPNLSDTSMPFHCASRARANQKAALAGVIHEAKVDSKIGELVSALATAADLDVVQKANVREAKERFERSTRISTELASKMAQLESEGYGAWVRAREANDYVAFSPMLSEILELRKQMLKLAKPEMELYDAAIDDFDPRMKVCVCDQCMPVLVRPCVPSVQSFFHLPRPAVPAVCHGISMC